METKIVQIEKVKLRSPVFVEGLPGIGNVGRVAAGYLISELKMKKFAELYSPHFLPLVIMHPDGTAAALKNEFYYYRGKAHDIIICTGDTQSVSPDGHYEIVEKMLDFVQPLGIKLVITLGGFAEGKPVEEPEVIGAVNDKALVKRFSAFGIKVGKEHPVGTIVGASGLLVGMARVRKIDAIALLGQTMGFPIVTDPKAADRVLHVLAKILDLKIDLNKLEKIIGEMDDKLKRAQKIQSAMMEHMGKGGGKDSEGVRYIG